MKYFCWIGTFFFLLVFHSPQAWSQAEVDAGAIVPVLTDSPRDTLSAFVRLSREFETAFSAYLKQRDQEHAAQIALISEQMISLIDLSDVPEASRRKVGGETAAYLLDIFGRIGLPDADGAPDLAAVGDETQSFAVPKTPFRITKNPDGVRAGEFLFSRETVHLAPRFYLVVRQIPLRSAVPVDSWSVAIRQISGPMIPISLIAAIPDGLKRIVLDVPIWKAIAVLAIAFIAALLLFAIHRMVVRVVTRSRWARLITPVAVVLATALLYRFFAFQINLTGKFSQYVDFLQVALTYLALTWAFWIICVAITESAIGSSRFSEGGIDASMLRLLARIVGVAGGIVILAHGAQLLGLPVFSILAGLGIGGLAVALAIRPTLENLISGFILYLDRPIRVGDFCTFGSQSGTVESIGVRSTQIRARDRTRISIPNSQFADMQIKNWAQCDQMMIKHIVGLRYETGTDQLRYVLVKIREMLHGHPRIDNDTIRVRFLEFANSSLNVEIRVYARTREWNDFYAIGEDLLFRVKDIVEESGTGFAFPSQTLYLSRDEGLNNELGEKSQQTVAGWRKAGRLPFPQFDPETAHRLNDMLDYPPRGSPDFRSGIEEVTEQNEERLSSAPDDDSEKTDMPR